jgi:hypothetical protein
VEQTGRKTAREERTLGVKMVDESLPVERPASDGVRSSDNQTETRKLLQESGMLLVPERHF